MAEHDERQELEQQTYCPQIGQREVLEDESGCVSEYEFTDEGVWVEC